MIASNEQLKKDRFGVADTQAHTHNGSDSVKFPYSNLTNKFFEVAWTLPGASAAIAVNYGTFYIALKPCFVSGFSEVHQVAGSNGGAVTLQLERLQGTEAPDSGDALLQTALSLKATANTVQNAKLVKTSYPTVQNNTLFLNTGDRLCLKDSGTLTDVSNVTVVVLLTLYP